MINNVLGKKLRNLRLENKMTQDDIAEILDMSRTSFSKYENGASTPPLSTLRKLAAIYNVSLNYLIYDDSAIISVRDEGNTEAPDPSEAVSSFTQLTRDEKKLIMKFRLLNSQKQEEIKDYVDNKSNE